MTKFDETPEERKINAMGKKALDEGLVRAVFTDQADGSTGGDARLIVVRAGVDDADLEKMETRGAILTPDGAIHNWLPILAFPKWGDWYPIKKSRATASPAAEKKNSSRGSKKRSGI
jgi:hypothetical protein